MHLITERLIIRDFSQDDKPALFDMIWQPNVVRFMRDWSEHTTDAEKLTGFIEYMQSKSACTDVRENKRYGIELRATGQLIGMVGMGLEETLGEVELAYFIGEAHQRKGYATEALKALFNWCMEISELEYMILTIDKENTPSCVVAEKAGFELFEERRPIGHKQPNMVSDSYYYYRKYRAKNESNGG